MKRQRVWIRRLGALVALLAVLIPAASVQPITSHAQANGAFELFYSDQTGYFFFWDPETWSVEGESSNPGVDTIRLSDGEVLVVVSAFLAPAATPTDCLLRVIDDLGADPSITQVEALTEAGGPPEINGGIANLIVTAQNADQSIKYAVRLDCFEVEPGQSLSLQTTIVPALMYNERKQELWTYGPDHLQPFVVFDRSLDDLGARVPGGVLLAYTPCAPSDDAFVIGRAANDGDGLRTEAPAFGASDDQGETAPVSLTSWLLPAAERVTSSVLDPGEVALFHVQLLVDADHDDYDLFYLLDSGQQVRLGSFSQQCQGGGGASPVLIDLE